MNYNNALIYLEGLGNFGIKPGLQRMHNLLQEMGDPHKKLRYIHVTGTNGKGSTIAFINSILTEAGYRVGVYTSPHLNTWNERIKLNNNYITDEEFARLVFFVKDAVDKMIEKGYEHPTVFEIITAIAFQFFSENCCDIVLLEVGLGGEFDATNVIDAAEVSIITKISMDHSEYLGRTIEDIARTKSGILKKGTTLVLYPQDGHSENIIIEKATKNQCKVIIPDFSQIKINKMSIKGTSYRYSCYEEFNISLLGEHQIFNSIVALHACIALDQQGIFRINLNHIKQGLMKAHWSGRIEVLNDKPYIIMDGAHNEDGVFSLVKALKAYFPNKNINFIFGVLKDKDYLKMTQYILPIAKFVSTVSPLSDRSLSAAMLADIIHKQNFDNVKNFENLKEALHWNLSQSEEDAIICIMGSLYVVGEAKQLYQKGDYNATELV
ncbi:bifunctional folylpolyglutamate synthase/dihydrofolate synthase (plasmid) [Paenibacillus polymyxa]|uniref:bifunctional folylpolyglutamate synthase/dihydrofolate synthase n=1 Tax=Paenibacillus polymyxa TaxID=1406 RepID=UPI003B59D2A1